jgi:glycine/D-amino acid oxidase-like deaminating enzyme
MTDEARRTIKRLPAYDQQGGWNEILPPRPEPTVLRGDVEADYAIVGAGYAGLAVARRLSELAPRAKIVLVEGTRIGNNAAGRSSGFAIDHAHNLRAKGFADDIANAKLQVAINRAGLDYLDKAIREHKIDCGWVREGKVHAAATDRGAKLLDNFAASLDAIDEDHTHLSRAELKDWFGTDYYQAGVHAPHSYLVQPAAMVRGLADHLPENVRVFENTMVTSVVYGRPHKLNTASTSGPASIAAENLVLANNGFVTGFGFAEKHLIPMITWGSMTRPMTNDEAARLGGRESYGIIGAHSAGSSVRRMPDGRILIRNIFSFSRRSKITGPWLDKARATHRASFEARYPMLRDVEFEHTWGGALSLTRNGAPLFGELSHNVYGCSVHNGVGIARGTISGKLLAEHMLGDDNELVQAMLTKGRPSRNYPEPFNSLGVRMNARWRRWQAGAEE